MFSREIIETLARSNMPAYVDVNEWKSISGHPLQEESERIVQLSNRDRSIEIDLENEVSKLRLATLKASHGSCRPAPLDQPDLKAVDTDKHGLVELSLFDRRCGGLAIGNGVFEMLPAIGARNSSYWTLLALNAVPEGVSPKIRLDPLMRSTREGYRAMFYKMFAFGQPLSWCKILTLSKEVAQRWMPDQPDKSDVAFTDAVWTPRDDEVHLRCEECPKPSAASFRPSRYFHAIISRKRESIVHCDGALRVFSHDQANERNAMHVRDAGKLGIRVKLFQIDDEVESGTWATLLKTFFVWNRDIERFAEDLAAG